MAGPHSGYASVADRLGGTKTRPLDLHVTSARSDVLGPSAHTPGTGIQGHVVSLRLVFGETGNRICSDNVDAFQRRRLVTNACVRPSFLWPLRACGGRSRRCGPAIPGVSSCACAPARVTSLGTCSMFRCGLGPSLTALSSTPGRGESPMSGTPAPPPPTGKYLLPLCGLNSLSRNVFLRDLYVFASGKARVYTYPFVARAFGVTSEGLSPDPRS